MVDHGPAIRSSFAEPKPHMPPDLSESSQFYFAPFARTFTHQGFNSRPAPTRANSKRATQSSAPRSARSSPTIIIGASIDISSLDSGQRAATDVGQGAPSAVPATNIASPSSAAKPSEPFRFTSPGTTAARGKGRRYPKGAASIPSTTSKQRSSLDTEHVESMAWSPYPSAGTKQPVSSPSSNPAQERVSVDFDHPSNPFTEKNVAAELGSKLRLQEDGPRSSPLSETTTSTSAGFVFAASTRPAMVATASANRRGMLRRPSMPSTQRKPASSTSSLQQPKQPVRQAAPREPGASKAGKSFMFSASAAETVSSRPGGAVCGRASRTPGAPRRRRQQRSGRQQLQPATASATVKTTLLFNVEGIASEAMPSMMPTQSSSRAESVADEAPALTAEEEQRRSLMAAAEHDHAAGNAAFQQANFEQAISLYTRAAEAIRPYPAGHEKLAVLLSNRAAALLALCKPLQALSDCRMALQYSPSFLKCGLRMATCYCRLGQLAEATASVQKVLDSPLLGTMAEEASRKMQEIKQLQMELATVLHMLGYELSSLECLPETATTWQKLPPLKEAFTRLESLRDRIPHAEYWHAARSEVLLRLCKFAEAVQATKMPQHKEVASDSHLATGTPWRCWLCAQAAYFQGEPMKAKELLQALYGVIRQQDSQCFPSGRKRAEESILEAVVPIPTAEEIESLLKTLDEMEIMRQRGNAAVTAGKYDGALKAYSDALAVGTLSPCLAAVFHSNRAAAHQGLGNVALALADCCIARALSPKYPKAHSRLAGLLAEVGMHSAAIDVLSVLLEIPGLSAASKRDYAARLATERQAASLRPAHAVLGAPASAPPINHYKLLGVERRCDTSDVRKAFKRLSLNLHPDKSAVTCRIASRWGTVGSCVMLEDTAQRVADGATWLFKCIGEAHEVLADASKRAELDAELELDAATSARFSPSGNRDRFWHRYGQPASSRWYYQYQ